MRDSQPGTAKLRALSLAFVVLAIVASATVWSGCGGDDTADVTNQANESIEEGVKRAEEGVREGAERAEKSVDEGVEKVGGAEKSKKQIEAELRQKVREIEKEASKYTD